MLVGGGEKNKEGRIEVEGGSEVGGTDRDGTENRTEMEGRRKT